MALKRVGALWRKKDKSDRDFYSGNIDFGALGDIRIMIFENEPKQEENHPDWIVHLATDETDDSKASQSRRERAKK
jgi:hypothetical protein